MLYQTYRLLLGNIDFALYPSLIVRYSLLRSFYSFVPVLVGAGFIGWSGPSARCSYAILAAATLVAPAYFTLYASAVFDSSVVGFCLASFAVLHWLRFRCMPNVREGVR